MLELVVGRVLLTATAVALVVLAGLDTTDALFTTCGIAAVSMCLNQDMSVVLGIELRFSRLQYRYIKRAG